MKAHLHLLWTLLILCMLPVGVCAAPPATSRIYVVSIGVSDYKCIDNLRLPEQDAKSIATLFKTESSKVVLLTNQQATKANIMKALNTVFTQSRPEDIILFYFSGHGFSEGFCTYTSNCKGGSHLTFDDIKSVYAKSKAKRKLIFADACYSGAIRSEAKTKKPKEAFKNQNIMLFLSSRTNETSLERSDMKNGFFTSFLVKGLQGKADSNKDKAITSRELFNYVSKNVIEISQGRQHPVMWGKFSDNLIITRKK